MSKGEFDVALGARVISKEAGGRIQVKALYSGDEKWPWAYNVDRAQSLFTKRD